MRFETRFPSKYDLGARGGFGPVAPYRSASKPGWVLPSSAADIDFVNNRAFVGGLLYPQVTAIPGWSFTRSGSRYSDTSAGGLTLFGANTPRITDKGLAVDAGATNLLTYSQAFDNAAWVKTASGAGSAPVVTANDATAPDGTTTADRIDFDRGGATSGDISQIAQAPVTSAGDYTGSVWLKAATGADVGKEIAIRHVGAAGYDIHVLTADWSRFEGVETRAANSFEIASRGTFSADQAVSLHAWGAQLETGSVATPHIPTAGSTASAGGDVATITDLDALGLTSAVQAAGYTVVVDWADSINGDGRIIDISSTTLIRRSGAGATLSFNSSGEEGSVSGAFSSGKAALADDPGASEVRGAADGSAVAVAFGTYSRVPLSQLYFGSTGSSNYLGGYIRRVTVYPYALTSAQLQAVSA